jgi:hypothetical protein
MKPRPYKKTDWPTSKRKSGGEKISRRRLPPLTPLEQWIEDDKERERRENLERPFDDPLPF